MKTIVQTHLKFIIIQYKLLLLYCYSDDEDDVEPKVTPASCSTHDKKLTDLAEIFPGKPVSQLEESLLSHQTFNEAVDSLITENDDAVSEVSNGDSELFHSILEEMNDKTDEERLAFELRNLSRKMSTEKVKLKIDEEDLLEDAIYFYKSPDFDPEKGLRVIYKGQLAADVGGVTRQFFT